MSDVLQLCNAFCQDVAVLCQDAASAQCVHRMLQSSSCKDLKRPYAHPIPRCRCLQCLSHWCRHCRHYSCYNATVHAPASCWAERIENSPLTLVHMHQRTSAWACAASISASACFSASGLEAGVEALPSAYQRRYRPVPPTTMGTLPRCGHVAATTALLSGLTSTYKTPAGPQAPSTVVPALRSTSCAPIDRLQVGLLDNMTADFVGHLQG